MTNRLYYGDNLEILRNREYFPDACVDLIYLDPPFNSNRDHNVLFKSESGARQVGRWQRSAGFDVDASHGYNHIRQSAFACEAKCLRKTRAEVSLRHHLKIKPAPAMKVRFHSLKPSNRRQSPNLPTELRSSTIPQPM